METPLEKPQRLMLHACCGPCSMEPVRLLQERGITPHIYYANSNIAPASEYEKRLDTIRTWTSQMGIDFEEGPYDPDSWNEQVGCFGAAEPGSPEHAERCRACYRMRFEEAASAAREGGFTALGTTLSVSPYQYTDIIREELERACANAGIDCFFEDYSPHYPEAVRRSKEAGLYRQDYCGCAFSKAEADSERTERAALRAKRKQERAAARLAEEAVLDERRRERAEYDAKQKRKREVLKALRNSRKAEDAEKVSS